MRLITLLLLATVCLNPATGWAEDCATAATLYRQARQTTATATRIKLLNQSVDLCERFNARYQLANAQARNGQLDQAAHGYKRALQLASTPRNQALAHARIAQLNLLGEPPDYPTALARLNAAFALLEQTDDTPPDWIQTLRKHVEDNMERNGIVPATLISRAFSTRTFTPVAKIDLRILFERDSARLTDQGRRQIRELSIALRKRHKPGRHIELIGHTDSRGAAAHNLALSKRRAESVQARLIQLAPELEKDITIAWKGETRLLYPGNSEDDHRRNRRVEVRLR